jgi:hypothetical protein
VRVVDRAGAIVRVDIAPEREAGDHKECDERDPAALHAAIFEEGEAVGE